MLVKDPYKMMKRQAMGKEKMFANHMPGKGLVCRIHKEHSRYNSKNNNDNNKNKITQKSPIRQTGKIHAQKTFH